MQDDAEVHDMPSVLHAVPAVYAECALSVFHRPLLADAPGESCVSVFVEACCAAC